MTKTELERSNLRMKDVLELSLPTCHNVNHGVHVLFVLACRRPHLCAINLRCG
jgi:hypothetical protein